MIPPKKTVPTGPRNAPARRASSSNAGPSNLFARLGGSAAATSSGSKPEKAQQSTSRSSPQTAPTPAPTMRFEIPTTTGLRSDRIALIDPRASFQVAPVVTQGAETPDYLEEQRRIKRSDEDAARQ